MLALVENRDPDAVTRLIAALPEGVRREIDGLNLALYDLSQARGHLILVHGRSDPMVPYSESQELAVAASSARVSLFLIDDIGHVEFTAVNVAQRLDDVAGDRGAAGRAALDDSFRRGRRRLRVPTPWDAHDASSAEGPGFVESPADAVRAKSLIRQSGGRGGRRTLPGRRNDAEAGEGCRGPRAGRGPSGRAASMPASRSSAIDDLLPAVGCRAGKRRSSTCRDSSMPALALAMLSASCRPPSSSIRPAFLASMPEKTRPRAAASRRLPSSLRASPTWRVKSA